MTKSTVLITGANGEVGHGLIKALAKSGNSELIALDMNEPSPKIADLCHYFYQGNILDQAFLKTISEKHTFDIMFHLASLLSSRAEKEPDLAHHVNVDGARHVMAMGLEHGRRRGAPVVWVFSSSIAAYGVGPDDECTQPVSERQYLTPVTMYGINKLYVESLGRYYSYFYHQSDPSQIGLDFRCLRFPGLISPETVPSGGTSDYGPEMLHFAARSKPYECFVGPETRLPFMVMSDAVRALVMVATASAEKVRHRIYNVSAFSATAEEIRQEVRRYFPNAEISYRPQPARQAIVDSWPGLLNDDRARQDWDWLPKYEFVSAFGDLLVPGVQALYP